jgi:hypothetical protein
MRSLTSRRRILLTVASTIVVEAFASRANANALPECSEEADFDQILFGLGSRGGCLQYATAASRIEESRAASGVTVPAAAIVYEDLQQEFAAILRRFGVNARFKIGMATEMVHTKGVSLVTIEENLFQEARQDPNYGGYILSAILAHEVAHVFQLQSPPCGDSCRRPIIVDGPGGSKLEHRPAEMKNSWGRIKGDRWTQALWCVNGLVNLPSTVRPIELHADFLCGWYIAQKKPPDDAIDRVAQFMFRIGDNRIFDIQHHGRPYERKTIFYSGVDQGLKNNDLLWSSERGLDAVALLRYRGLI